MDNLIIYQEPSYKLTPMVLLLAFLLIWCIRWRRCWNKEIRSLGESYKHDALTVLLLTYRELRGGVRIWVCNTIQYFMSYIHSVDVRHFCLSVARRYSSYNYNKKKKKTFSWPNCSWQSQSAILVIQDNLPITVYLVTLKTLEK